MSGTYNGVYKYRGALYTYLTHSVIYYLTLVYIPETDKDLTIMKGGKKLMPATSKTQKGTAMDYLSAPRDSGIVKSLMASIGYEAPKGGRLPAGVKLDTLIALDEAFTVEDFSDFVSSIQTRVAELQAGRRTASVKVSATPESIVNAVKSGKISLSDLKDALSSLD